MQGLSSATASTQQPGDELSGVGTVKAKSLNSAEKVPNDASSHLCWCMNTSTPYCLLFCWELGNVAGVINIIVQKKKKNLLFTIAKWLRIQELLIIQLFWVYTIIYDQKMSICIDSNISPTGKPIH